MNRRRLAAGLVLAAIAGLVAWALTGLPGAPAPCPAAGCDCEASAPGAIRQPANAWSASALAAAGLWALATSSRARPAGPGPSPRCRRGAAAAAAWSLVAAGGAAFLFHAGLTAWAARVDGLAVGVLGAAFAWQVWVVRGRGPAGPVVLLAVGGLCWFLGRSGGPWCRPASLFQAHALWHLLAAAALAWWLAPQRPGAALPRTPRAL